MAMNKKEREALELAQKELGTIAALRWTAIPYTQQADALLPDVLPPSSGFDHVVGWQFNAHSGVVERGWSECVAHGRGEYPASGYRSASQGSRPLYSTKLKALQAMRHAIEKECAARLHQVDEQIAKEMENT